MIKTKLLTILSICLIMGSSTSLAGERTEREMLAIARQQLNKAAMARASQSVATGIEKLVDQQQYCIYGQEDAGFVVVSRNDELMPVLGYSTTTFNAENMPCGMRWWLSSVEKTTDNNRLRHVPAHKAVEKLVTTTWGQGAPYNYFTPEINGMHTPTGCLATAMSQLMNFFKYPAKGKGKGYYTKADNSTHIPENIESVYEWDKMLDSYKGVTLTEELARPVATLMRDAGIATYMNYGTSGSGGQEYNATRGFTANFSYVLEALRCYQRVFFSDEEWMSMVYEELSKGRPILYCGTDPLQGGHAFIVDGVDSEGRVHVNWGWNGECDGYYDLFDLSPRDERGNVTSHFTEEQSMVFGLKAQEDPDADDHIESFWGITGDYALALNKTMLKINAEALYNFHFLEFNGAMYLYFENLDEAPENNFIPMIGQKGSWLSFHGMNSLNQTLFLTKLKPGHYRVFLTSKDDSEKDYQPVRCIGGAICYYLTINDDRSTELSDAQPMQPTGIEHLAPTTLGATNAIYDLQGRKVKSPGKGIYIRNGRKVIY